MSQYKLVRARRSGTQHSESKRRLELLAPRPEVRACEQSRSPILLVAPAQPPREGHSRQFQMIPSHLSRLALLLTIAPPRSREPENAQRPNACQRARFLKVERANSVPGCCRSLPYAENQSQRSCSASVTPSRTTHRGISGQSVLFSTGVYPRRLQGNFKRTSI